MKLLPSLFKSKESMITSSSWQWPSSCKHPKTFSFRVNQDDIFKTVNSVYFDPNDGVETPDSWFTNSLSSASFSTTEESHDLVEVDGESLEMVIRGATSEERLFFEAGGGGDTSSILKNKNKNKEANKSSVVVDDDDDLFKESVVLSMESENPYLDFKKSMEEMVEINGMKDWKRLEELLGWYLRMNGKKNHGFIVDAFVDLLVSHATTTTTQNDSTSYCSAASSSFSSMSRSPLCSLEDEINEIDDHDDEEEQKMVL
ncbi:hypothetical protein Ddye_029078 [Dipteronia dyeriana]|uniref:Transcription repressor n=1 Tax=Dipteronia dyeriana TaxID=168575 RepID=A0AAD9TE47_9ROSI|nr:hypothetical protein Ddye_029078 [Dipteronia dyeriana]